MKSRFLLISGNVYNNPYNILLSNWKSDIDLSVIAIRTVL